MQSGSPERERLPDVGRSLGPLGAVLDLLAEQEAGQ